MSELFEIATAISKLSGYQALVYMGLIQVVEPAYSDTEALALVEKYSQMIAERERRRFEPYATAKAIQEREVLSASSDLQSDKNMLDWLQSTVEGAHVSMCFEVDGGLHVTVEPLGGEVLCDQERQDFARSNRGLDETGGHRCLDSLCSFRRS